MLLFPLGFLRYMLLKVAAFSCLRYCLAYVFCCHFKQNSQVFVSNKCVLWLLSRSCFTAIFVSWLCQACIGTRDLILLNFSYPGLVYSVFFGSRAEVVLWTIFCFLTVSSIYWNQGLDFAKFFTPWSCLLCVLWLQSRSCFTAIFVTLSSIC